MTKRRQKKSHFGLGLLIYALILMLLCAGALYEFHKYVDAREASRPELLINAYSESLKTQIPAACRDTLSSMVTGEQSLEEILSWAEPAIHESRMVKDYPLSNNEQQVYQIRAADGRKLGSVTFSVTGTGEYGLPVWSVTDEQFDFSSYGGTTGVTVPSGYKVYLGDRLLDQDEIVERDLPYDVLEECYLHYENLPTMVRYESRPFLGVPVLRIFDEKGTELSQDELSQERFLDNCSQELQEKADAFIRELIPIYVRYSADINGSAMQYYNALASLAVPDSQLRTRMDQALSGFGWSQTKGLEIVSIHLNRLTDLGEGRYLADVTYETNITSRSGTTLVTDHARVVLFDLDGEFKADAIYHY